MWQEWLGMVSVEEEIKPVWNVSLAGAEATPEVHEIVIYVEKIDKEWFFTFMLGAASEANGALKWTKGSAFSIQNIFRCGAHCQGVLWKSDHEEP